MSLKTHRISATQFPELALWNVLEPPSELFVQGEDIALRPLLQSLPDQGLAVVGTRAPQPRSIALVKAEIARLAGSGLVIVSGFARGIDATAHRAALDAGLPTVAVLAGGLDLDYPRESSSLRRQIVESGGLLISEFPDGTEPRPAHFLRRNRLIAGWARATWVVEAGHPSGALNTAKWARDQDRVVYATPSFPGDRAFSGNQSLLDDHHASCFWGAHSIGSSWMELATLGRGAAPARFASEEARALHGELAQATAQRGGAHAPELLNWAIERGWPAETFFLTLRQLAFSHHAEETAGIWIAR